MSFNVKQISLVGFCAAVGLSIYFLPKKAPAGILKQMPTAKVDTSFSINDYQVDAKNKLDSVSIAKLNSWESLSDSNSLRNISGFWASINNAGLSAYFVEKLALKDGKVESWYNSAFRYLMASRNSDKMGEKLYFTRKAINAFSKVLELDPSNLEAKANLGVCYVEGSQVLGTQPMQGVLLLKEVLEKDSKNITALINLGYFSIQSGQYEKAIERFNQVLEFKPDYIDAYIYLADTYQRMGKKSEAIKVLETLKSKNKNPEIETNVNEFIQELKAS